ncbi:MAG TPA: hypothetical protein VFN76_01975 [Candidatus Limnocylindria bacterium]|nr:hypothetical protein [Candidatus Limnocylindria bacterium]
MIASLLALPSLASAAPKGSGVSFTVTPLIDTVSPNMNGAFEAVIRNAGPATLTHATFTATLDGAAVGSVPAGCSMDLTCELGKLAAGDARTLRFVVKAHGSGGSVTIDATLLVDAGRGNPSMDAFFDRRANIAVNASSSFFGTWHGAGNALNGAISSGHQAASVNVPAVSFDYAATLAEATRAVCGKTGIGNAVDLQFADGEVVSPFLKVAVSYDSAARGDRTPSNVKVVHRSDDGTCTFLVKGCATAGCYTAKWKGSGAHKKLVIEVLLPHNGIVKGF